jgi:eukaryotic-like serine/threonine-protein kinase
VERVGPYRIVRKLGQGGMAQVFLAVAFGASGFEKRVAIKLLLPELEHSPELVRALIEEARLGSVLTHKNLVQVHQLGVADGRYYVVMDFVDGQDLATLARRGPTPPELALLAGEELARALDYVHRVGDEAGRPLGLVHRDVSPSNVLISRAGEVRLGDFGVAKATLLADITRGNVRKGKYAYMSPEQVGGELLTAASDQFSLGVTLYELLAGRRPFDGDGPHETMERVRRADAPDAAPLPPPARELVLRALSRDPAARFASAEELRRAIAEARREFPAVGEPDLAAWAATASAR